MLTSEQISEIFNRLNIELKNCGEIGEVGIVGGAVMCLVFNARQATKDIDAIFEPSRIIRKLVVKIATEMNLPPDCLNDAVKGYIQGNFQKREVLNLSNLRVWAPEPEYMLAMKCISARWDSHDKDDVSFLIKHLKIVKAKDVFKIIEKFYPTNKVPAKTQFLVEELLAKKVKK